MARTNPTRTHTPLCQWPTPPFWGDTLEQRLKYQKRRGLKFGRAGNTTKSYLKYECQFSGGAPPSKADAVHALVEWEGRVRYGYLVEDSARCVLQEVYRAHATYKYTQSASINDTNVFRKRKKNRSYTIFAKF